MNRLANCANWIQRFLSILSLDYLTLVLVLMFELLNGEWPFCSCLTIKLDLSRIYQKQTVKRASINNINKIHQKKRSVNSFYSFLFIKKKNDNRKVFLPVNQRKFELNIDFLVHNWNVFAQKDEFAAFSVAKYPTKWFLKEY